ncbi:nodulation-signaling pathway 2 protein-like [Pistacia vera]|uniref:nodulation-signaling pathway 2 protein-like n=1 Tax=Pistacia vera TaxID=55513 RepID=UPI00126339A3|nr:nodulation-signaling pathway 2 protein-like [Pistacia vera]
MLLQEEDPISANTIPGDEILGNENLKRLLQIETELMDFASISQDTVSSSPGSSLGKEMSPGMVQAKEEKILKGIQEKLNEESSVTDLLVMGAEAVEARNRILSSAIVAKLNTNQAILEATKGDQEIHVIDFHIMEGTQWPPLMVDLASRKNVVSLRVTAIITDQENSISVQQTGRRLKEFADSIHFRFIFDQILIMTDKDFESIKTGHTLIANCMMHQLHMPKRSLSQVKTVMNGVTKLSPKILILVEEELFSFTRTPSMSFVKFFCEALHHYTALSDSLLSNFSKQNEPGLKQIEKEFLEIRILDTISQFPSGNKEKMQ